MRKRVLSIKLHDGLKPPLFCIDGTFIFTELAQHLGTEQQVYGLLIDADINRRDFKERADVRELALHYAQHILNLQPDGPYYLCGLCYGGRLAFEVAKELQTQGHQIATLILIETPGPRYQRKALIRCLPQYFRHFRQMNFQGKITFIFYKFPLGFQRRAKGIKRGIKGRIQGLWINLANRRINSLTPLNADKVSVGVRAKDVVLFLGENSSLGYSSADSRFGWSELSNLDVRYVPGDHTGVLKEPHVQALALQMRALLT